MTTHSVDTQKTHRKWKFWIIYRMEEEEEEEKRNKLTRHFFLKFQVPFSFTTPPPCLRLILSQSNHENEKSRFKKIQKNNSSTPDATFRRATVMHMKIVQFSSSSFLIFKKIKPFLSFVSLPFLTAFCLKKRNLHPAAETVNATAINNWARGMSYAI